MNEQTEVHNLPQIEEEIRRFESEKISALRYSPQLRRRFQSETSASRSRMLFVQGLLSLLAYDCFIVGDYFMSPAHIVSALVIRFAIVTPLVIAVAFAVRNSRKAIVQETAASLLCLIGAISIMIIHRNVDASFISEMQTGIIMVLLGANCVLRIDLPYAVITTSVILLLDFISLNVDVHVPHAQRLTAGGMIFWVAILTLTANYTLTRERRFSYLLQLRGRLQRGLLADANAELLALSSTDRLTGLPNRRAYDTRLADLWQLSGERSQPISAIMVDVDHFKRLNDTHGHPYGDRVLQRVGSLLQQALRSDDDFVARFGGEEFVVLLPNCGLEIAAKIAERIRTLVQVAGSPSLQRDSNATNEVWATVSCGVAMALPATSQDSARLIADADAAMYRAKKEGRNRVCAAPLPNGSPSKITVFPNISARG